MTAFARVTETHDALSLSLTPCAGQLYRWLLRRKPAGRNQELELEDFATWSGAFRKNPYSVRHIQRALSELIETQLVDVVKRYTSQIFKLVCHHPSDPVRTPPLGFPFDDKNVQIQDRNVQVETEMSKTGHSNPHHSVTTCRECRETTDKKYTTTHPVQKDVNKERLVSGTPNLSNGDCIPSPMLNTSEEEESDKTPIIDRAPIFSEYKKIDPELEQQVKEAIAPCPFNGQLKRLVLETGADLVVDAIRVVKQARKNHKVKNPAGLFRRAIERQWKPGDGFDDSAISNEFNEWFKLARKAGLVMSSQFHDGQLWVFNPQAERLTYEEMLRRHPLESLKQTPDKSQAATKGVKTSPSTTPVKPAPFPLDFSEVLTAIDIQLSRLGWGQEQVKAFLKQMYGQTSRSLLRDEELMDFKEQLLAL